MIQSPGSHLTLKYWKKGTLLIVTLPKVRPTYDSSGNLHFTFTQTDTTGFPKRHNLRLRHNHLSILDTAGHSLKTLPGDKIKWRIIRSSFVKDDVYTTETRYGINLQHPKVMPSPASAKLRFAHTVPNVYTRTTVIANNTGRIIRLDSFELKVRTFKKGYAMFEVLKGNWAASSIQVASEDSYGRSYRINVPLQFSGGSTTYTNLYSQNFRELIQLDPKIPQSELKKMILNRKSQKDFSYQPIFLLIDFIGPGDRLHLYLQREEVVATHEIDCAIKPKL